MEPCLGDKNSAHASSQMLSYVYSSNQRLSIIAQVFSVASPCIIIKGETAGHVTTRQIKASNQLFKRLTEDLLFKRNCTRQTETFKFKGTSHLIILFFLLWDAKQSKFTVDTPQKFKRLGKELSWILFQGCTMIWARFRYGPIRADKDRHRPKINISATKRS